MLIAALITSITIGIPVYMSDMPTTVEFIPNTNISEPDLVGTVKFSNTVAFSTTDAQKFTLDIDENSKVTVEIVATENKRCAENKKGCPDTLAIIGLPSNMAPDFEMITVEENDIGEIRIFYTFNAILY